MKRRIESILAATLFASLVFGCPNSLIGEKKPSDKNAAPADIRLSHGSVAEKSPVGTAVGILSAEDPEGDDISFRLARDVVDNNFFTIQGTKLLVNSFLRISEGASRTVRVTAADASGSSSTKDFSITLSPVVGLYGTWVVASPSFSQVWAISDSKLGTFTTASDIVRYDNIERRLLLGAGSAPTTYQKLSWTADDPTQLNIHGGNDDPDVAWEDGNIYATVECRMSDRNPMAPYGIRFDGIASDGSAVGTLVGRFVSRDLEIGDSATYEPAEGGADNVLFDIDSGQNLHVKFVPDFSTKNTYTLRVRALDSKGNASESDVLIPVGAPPGATFDLEGAWSGSWYGSVTVEFTKSTLRISGEQDLSGYVVRFDNENKEGMLFMTDRLYLEQFQRFSWEGAGPSTLRLGLPRKTYEEAAAAADDFEVITLNSKM